MIEPPTAQTEPPAPLSPTRQSGARRVVATLAAVLLLVVLTVANLSLLRLHASMSPEETGAYWLVENADIVALASTTLVALGLLATWSRSLRTGLSTVVVTGALAAVVLAVGSWLVWNEGEGARAHLRAGLEGLAPTYASEMRVRGHARLSSTAAAGDPLYLDLIDSEKRWLRMNLSVADIYTVRRDAAGTWRFIVDSETDYNHSGAIDEEREQRTPIGEAVGSSQHELSVAATGKAVFQDRPETDRWGTWVSAFVPIYDDSGAVEAVLGVDFPASGWAATIAGARWGMSGYLGVILAILFGGALLQVTYLRHMRERAENERTLRAQAIELEAARAAADAANGAKSEFLANMSHEIRTPMTAIIGYVDMLTDPDMPPPMRAKHAETIKRSGRHLLGIINNILDISKIESGKMTVESIDCNLRSVVDEAIELVRGLAEKKGLSLNVDWHESAPGAIRSDPMRVREILVNLLGNAIKYTEEGSVTLTVWSGPAAGDSASVLMSVRDTGIGIDAGQAASLFRPFTQAEGTHARRFGGTGLGLVISRRLAEMLGGTITVESIKGEGSTFTVSIAACTASLLTAPAGAVPASVSALPGPLAATGVSLPVSLATARTP